MIALIYGLPGAGKTTYMHDLIRSAPKGNRYLIADHANEWGDSQAPHWRGKAPNLTIFDENFTVEQACDEIESSEKTDVFVFQMWEGIKVAEVCTVLGNCTYVDDEIDLVARKANVNGIGWDESPIRKIVHQGRHLRNRHGEICEVHLLGAARRPQSLHTDVSEQAGYVAIFRIQGKRTLERLHADSHIEEDDWDTIRTMPNFYFREWPSGKFLKIKPIGDVKEKEEKVESESSADDLDEAEEAA